MKLNGFYFIVAIVGFNCIAGAVSSVRGDDLEDRMKFWRQQAFVCSEDGRSAFPSKERVPTADNPSKCDDGDMTLFNGLLCATGEEIGCEGVRLAQGPNGRWWRSPGRIGVEYPRSDVSFSPDQARGVLLYVTTKKDLIAFDNWMVWIASNRPCILGNVSSPRVELSCLVSGWPRLCRDDQVDRRCTFRPGTCANQELVGDFLGSSKARICREVLSSFGVDVKDFIYPTALLAVGAAAVNESDYPMHLAAVELYLLATLNHQPALVKLGGEILAQREPRNPFFVYLAEGPTPKVRGLLLDQCPAPGAPSRSKSQWSWERPMSNEPWKDSMYWDCIFVGRLLGAS